MSNRSIRPIDSTLSDATTQSRPGSEDNDGVLRILQSSSIIIASLLDCLMSYPGHSLEEGLTPLQRCIRCVLWPQPTGIVM